MPWGKVELPVGDHPFLGEALYLRGIPPLSMRWDATTLGGSDSVDADESGNGTCSAGSNDERVEGGVGCYNSSLDLFGSEWVPLTQLMAYLPLPKKERKSRMWSGATDNFQSG